MQARNDDENYPDPGHCPAPTQGARQIILDYPGISLPGTTDSAPSVLDILPGGFLALAWLPPVNIVPGLFTALGFLRRMGNLKLNLNWPVRNWIQARIR